jgi:hypothetical protein
LLKSTLSDDHKNLFSTGSYNVKNVGQTKIRFKPFSFDEIIKEPIGAYKNNPIEQKMPKQIPKHNINNIQQNQQNNYLNNQNIYNQDHQQEDNKIEYE